MPPIPTPPRCPFLRPHRKQIDGADSTYWSLVKTVPTARGRRHQFVARLGKLDELETQQLRDWIGLDALRQGTVSPATQRALDAPPPR